MPERWKHLRAWLKNQKRKILFIGFVVVALAMGIGGYFGQARSERIRRDMEVHRGLAAHMNGDYQTALKIWKPLAHEGDDAAQALLAQAYQDGRGVAVDLREAHRWRDKSATNGHRFAQMELGRNYELGEVVRQDYLEAAKWYRRSAVQGTVQAQTMLGVLYAEGRGVPQDYVRAHMWLNISASNPSQYDDWGFNLPSAKALRDSLTTRMTTAQVALAQEWARQCLDSKYSKCDP